jgi:hypothetical protein
MIKILDFATDKLNFVSLFFKISIILIHIIVLLIPFFCISIDSSNYGFKSKDIMDYYQVKLMHIKGGVWMH